MTRDKWQDLLKKIEAQFDVIERDTEDLDPEEGGGTLEYIIFVGPLGEMRAELLDTPRVVNRKVFQSKRIGSGAHEQLEYDKNERVISLHIFKWSDSTNDWEEIDASALS